MIGNIALQIIYVITFFKKIGNDEIYIHTNRFITLFTITLF